MSISHTEVIKTLNNLLLDEYLQRDVYETYSYYLFGLCSPALQQHLKEHRAEEDKHIALLQRYLMGFQAEPLLKRLAIPKISPPITNILKKDLELEQRAVKHYAEASRLLTPATTPEFISLRVDVENILIQEQGHVHDLVQWLGREQAYQARR